MTAVTYLRRSSAPSADSRTVSFEMQEAAVRDLAQRHGDSLDHVLSDWARSGGSTKRPGYQELLRRIDDDRVQVIYGYSLSRLSRSIVDFADLMERCRLHHVTVRLVQDGTMDWATASGRAFAQMAAVFAQFERELAKERIQSAYAARRERGDVLGQAPYGYRIEGGALVRRADEDPEDVIRAFRETGSFGRAAKLLNARAVKTRRHGTTWSHTVVSDILRQQAPADLAVPLALARPKAKAVGTFALSGLLGCACGMLLTGRRAKRTDGSLVVEYYCNRGYRTPGHGKMVTREHLLRPALETEAALLQLDIDGYSARVAADQAERGGLEAKRARIIEAFVDGVVDRGERDRRLAKVDSALAALAESTVVEYLPDAIDWTWPAPELNAVLRALWERVTLDAQLRFVSAHWRVPEWRAAT